MITLKTGLPRNGKTLSAVDELAKLFDRWEKHPSERRQVFQHGIPDLALEVEPLPVFPMGGSAGDEIPLTAEGKPATKLAFDQGSIPDGALIVIDECQDFFPPRGPSVPAPAHVSSLNTHGHRNLDYVLMTQHPKLIDNAVRRLINRHQHYRRMFGGKRAVTYEWDVCSDNLDFPKAVKGVYAYPRRRFGLYRSAVGFTKPKFKLPAFLIVPALAVPLAIWAGPAAVRTMYGATTGKGVSSSVPAVPASAPASAARAASSASPAASAASAVPLYSGCISMGERCSCVSSEGLFVRVEPQQCLDNVASSGHGIPYFVSGAEHATAFASPKGGAPGAAPGGAHSAPPVTTINGSPPGSTQRSVPPMSKSFL